MEQKHRTIAVRVEPAFYETLRLLAQIRGNTLTDEFMEALREHVARQSKEVDLAAEAQKRLDEIDSDAASKRSAIQSMLAASKAGPAPAAAPKGGRSKAK